MKKKFIAVCFICFALVFGLHNGEAAMYFVDGDWDGDGKIDIAVHITQTAGDSWWHIFQSADKTVNSRDFGYQLTVPTPGDYDGDGKTDWSLYQPISPQSKWHIIHNREYTPGGPSRYEFEYIGSSDEKPVPGDYNGDGRTDMAVYKQSWPAPWTIKYSGGEWEVEEFGWQDAIPVPGDYDGDGETDYATFVKTVYPAYWKIKQSSIESGDPYRTVKFGWSGVDPAPADYDYDGTTEIAVDYIIKNAGHRDVLQRTVYPVDENPPSSGASTKTQEKEIGDAWELYENRYKNYDFVDRTNTNHFIWHIDSDSFTGSSDTERFNNAALQFKNSPDYNVLVLGNRTYLLDNPIYFEDCSRLMIIGSDGTLVYSGAAVQVDVDEWDKQHSGSAFLFRNYNRNTIVEKVLIANVSFQGRKLDRRFPLQNIYLDVEKDGVPETWNYQAPRSSHRLYDPAKPEDPKFSENYDRVQGVFVKNPKQFVVIDSKFQHYNGSGVATHSDIAGTEKIRIINSEFVDCMNYIDQKAFYVNYAGKRFFLKEGGVEVFPDRYGAININCQNNISIRDIEIDSNTINGPLLDGIFIHGEPVENINISNNYVRGYNFHFNRLLTGKARAFRHSSEMGIHIVTSGGYDITINNNYVAGFLCESIVMELWDHCDNQVTELININNNILIDSAFRGIALYNQKYKNSKLYQDYTITGNRFVGIRYTPEMEIEVHLPEDDNNDGGTIENNKIPQEIGIGPITWIDLPME